MAPEIDPSVPTDGPPDYKTAAREFEPRWQQHWSANATHHTPNPGEPGFDGSKPKFVVLDFFPYPSGIGLHIGHPLGYIATDVLARFKRMSGANVLHAMGFDSFGLPAEQYAIQTGQHPRVTTDANIANMTDQLALLGLGHDPQRVFATSDPEYYRWTQWLFLVLFESYYDPTEIWTGPDGHVNTGRARPIAELVDRLRAGEWAIDGAGGAAPATFGGRPPANEAELTAAVERARLAVKTDMPVNWCPGLGTVLSNEEVTNDGRSERGNFPVYRRSLRQWVLRITKYADRLMADLDKLDWPHGIVTMQRDWIGRSEGASIDFVAAPAAGGDTTRAAGSGRVETIRVFTTRPDTVFGATFLVLAPEHPAVDVLVTDEQRDAVADYRASASTLRGQRGGDDDKSGVFTGAFATNPATGEQIPIWIAAYVLMEYGTGAIMAVPAHDQRDFEFAARHGIEVRVVIDPPTGWLEANAPDGLRGPERPERSGAADVPPRAVIDAYRAAPGSFAAAFSGDGVGVNSANDQVSLNGLPTPEAKTAIIDWLASGALGERRITYRLRDWLFSRQRYWGEPFPVATDVTTGQVHALAESELPVVLPDLDDFRPVTGQSDDSEPAPPLSRATEWVTFDGWIDDDGRAHSGVSPGDRATVRLQRDVNTMPNWAGSCWYYLRYFDPQNTEAFVSPEAERYWSFGNQTVAGSAAGGDGSARAGAVDLYVGGAEHAVLHLLYARFWHKVLYDRGLVSTVEPFQKLFNQGMITADAYHDGRGIYVDIHDVEVRMDGNQKVAIDKTNGQHLTIQPGKMGKRYKNGLPPEEVAAEYTVDTLRAYEMFLGPLDASKPWQAADIIGTYRFLRNVYRLATERDRWPLAVGAPDPEAERLVHRTVARVTNDIGRLRLNTALSALMELTNGLQKQSTVSLDHLVTLTLLVSPFAPHLGEELLTRLVPEEHAKRGATVHFDWPTYDEALLATNTVDVPVQVNGKARAVITVEVGIAEADLIAAAQSHPKIADALAGKQLVKTIAKIADVPKIVSFVAK